MSVFTLTHVKLHGHYALRVHQDGRGNSHYKVVECGGPGWHVLLEIGVARDGRKVDYLKLDKFWGRVPRPLDVGGTPGGDLPRWQEVS